MAAKFQNPSTKQQQIKVVVVQQNGWDNALTAMLTLNRPQTSDSYIEGREQTKRRLQIKARGQRTKTLRRRKTETNRAR